MDRTSHPNLTVLSVLNDGFHDLTHGLPERGLEKIEDAIHALNAGLNPGDRMSTDVEAPFLPGQYWPG